MAIAEMPGEPREMHEVVAARFEERLTPPHMTNVPIVEFESHRPSAASPVRATRTDARAVQA